VPACVSADIRNIDAILKREWSARFVARPNDVRGHRLRRLLLVSEYESQMPPFFSSHIICIVGRCALPAGRVVAPCLQYRCRSKGGAERKGQTPAADRIMAECRVADCEHLTPQRCGGRLRNR
jgi:hypothetical protein